MQGFRSWKLRWHPVRKTSKVLTHSAVLTANNLDAILTQPYGQVGLPRAEGISKKS